jgi:hypothetical protein
MTEHFWNNQGIFEISERPSVLRYRREFLDFVCSLGLNPAQVGAAEKILWLQTHVDPRMGRRYHTLSSMASAMRGIGVGDSGEQLTQHEIVGDFLTTLRNSGRLRVPREPSPAMPDEIFHRVMLSFKPGTCGARCRFILLLGRYGGLQPAAIRRLRTGSIECRSNGLTILWRPNAQRRLRPCFVPAVPNSEICSVRAFEEWKDLSRMPNDLQAYVFPAMANGAEHVQDWHEICGEGPEFIDWPLKQALTRIGAQTLGYNFTSLRREYARWCRNTHGEVMATQLSGFSSPTSLARLLRAEPDWKNLPRSLLDEEPDNHYGPRQRLRRTGECPISAARVNLD